jgi:hypothetical protein
LCEKKCCPIWAIITIILALVAVAVIVHVVLKKLHVLDHYHIWPVDEGSIPEENLENADDNGVRYTTDKDFEQ